jgi:hypothetical protein
MPSVVYRMRFPSHDYILRSSVDTSKSASVGWGAVSARCGASRLGAVLLACAMCVGACGSTATDVTTPNLSKRILRAAEVSPGYQHGPQHQTLASPSGGLCAVRLQSESLRTARLQTVFTNPHLPRGKRHVLSNEVIAYRSGGAQRAMRELSEAAAACPPSYRIDHIVDPHLPAGYVALKVVLGTGKMIWIYQARNGILSQIVAFGHKGGSYAELLQFALHVAEESARNLG